MACEIHNYEGKKKIMVCVSCNYGVCDLCIENSHNEHKLLSYDTVAQDIIGRLQQSTTSPQFKQMEDQLEDQLKCLIELRQCEADQAVRTKEELQEQQDQIKQLVDKFMKTAVTKLHTDNILNELDKVEKNVNEEIQKVHDFKKAVDRLKTLSPLDIVEQGWRMKVPQIQLVDFPHVSKQGKEMKKLFGELKQEDPPPPATLQSETATHKEESYKQNSSQCSSIDTFELYWDGPDGDSDIKTHITSSTDTDTQLKSTENPQSLQCDVNLTHKHSFNISQTARAMKPTSDGNCWVKCHADNTVKLVCTNGDVASIIYCNSPVLDMAVVPVTKQILFTFTTENVIKQLVNMVGRDPIMSSLIHTGPLRPCFMCVTHRGDILVTLTNKTSWSVEPNSTTELVKYSSNGRKLAVVRKDEHGDDLFFVSDGISIDNNGRTVVVINATDKNPMRSHLVMLDQQLNLKLRYISDGATVAAEEQMSKQTKEFWITGALFNQHNLLLISEFYSRTVQLLDPMCKLLKVLVREHQAPPRSLALQSDSVQLWVGLWGGVVQVYKHTCESTHDQ